jgi:lipid-binding SYLF domain-containing protein
MRSSSRRSGLLAAACYAMLAAVPAHAQQQPIYLQPAPQLQPGQGGQEVQTVLSAKQTLDEFGKMAIESIPPAMLHSAEGVAIFPNMVKGGFILGVNYGRGVLMVRKADRTWSAPVMVTMGGGSLGFQAGVQSADIVLVFATPKSLQGILNGQKVTLGADASVALGPVGRQANAGTDARLGAEIYSYARSRGLFAGVSLGGADISIDNNADAMLYGRFGVTPADVFNGNQINIRPEVQQLIDDLNARTRPAPPPAAPVMQQPGQQPFGLQAGGQAAMLQPAAVPPATIQPIAPQQPAAAAPPAANAPPLVPIR